MNSTGSADGDSMLRQPHLELQLLFTHAQLIARMHAVAANDCIRESPLHESSSLTTSAVRCGLH